MQEWKMESAKKTRKKFLPSQRIKSNVPRGGWGERKLDPIFALLILVCVITACCGGSGERGREEGEELHKVQ